MTEDPFADPLQRPRYTGIPTLMRAPHTEDLDEADVALVGVPLDGGVTNRPGARHGPRELRNQSGLMRAFNPANRINPYELARVRDVGDALIRRPFRLEDSLDDIEAFFREVHAAGAAPISAGGDHSLTLPVFRAIAADRPVGMVHFDAHCDTGGPRWGTAVHHGAPFKVAVEEGLLDPARTVQIGIRGATAEPDAWRFSYESGMRVITMDEFHRLGVEEVIAEARRGGGRRADLRLLRRGRARSGVRTGDRHPRGGRLHYPRGAAHAAGGCAGSTLVGGRPWWRSPRPSTRAATPPSSGPR